MWRQLTAAFLLLAFTAGSFCKSVIVLDYYTNTAAFAKNCINKARPKMRCNGRCQMMKKLQQEEKKDQENTGRKQENKNEAFFANTFVNVSFPETQTTRHVSGHTVIQKPVDRTYSLLHPPCTI